MSAAESEARGVLVPAGNKVRSPPTRVLKSVKKVETVEDEKGKKGLKMGADLKGKNGNYSSSAGSVLRRQEWLLKSNLSLNASCSSDASMDSVCSRASTGRIGRGLNGNGRRRQSGEKKAVIKLIPKIVTTGGVVGAVGVEEEVRDGKKRCSWVTQNTDPCYAAFHDQEWGVPVHDDKKLFELLVLSSALAELTWPTILTKRHIFREIFMDFDPELVSKLNEKKIVAPGSMASSLLSEPKLRSIIENARQILKIIEEFGSFDRYCWSFVNQKPILSRFRYSRQVPVKTPKADVLSKDLMRRGFRSVGPTVIYSFMQAVGITNDHLLTCYRFEECATESAASSAEIIDEVDNTNATNGKCSLEGEGDAGELGIIDLELARAVNGMRMLSSS